MLALSFSSGQALVPGVVFMPLSRSVPSIAITAEAPQLYSRLPVQLCHWGTNGADTHHYVAVAPVGHLGSYGLPSVKTKLFTANGYFCIQVMSFVGQNKSEMDDYAHEIFSEVLVIREFDCP